MRKKRILVVDDNVDNRWILSYRLYQLGEWDILEAENGQQALELVEREQLDLVFMDLRMPVLDGWGAIRRIRALSTPMRDVPIIVLTSQPPESEETAARAVGCDAYLTKPVNTQVIRKTIEALAG